MGFGSNRYAYADANCYGHCNQYAHSYSAANSDRLADSNIDTNLYCYRYGYSYSHSYRYSDGHGFAYAYALRYAAMHTWLVGGTGFPQRPSSLGGCLFLWGLGPKVLRHGRALCRYSRKRFHASV